MNDEKKFGHDTNQPPLRTPNREYRRTPPVIEGEAATSQAEADVVKDDSSPETTQTTPLALESAPSPDIPAAIDEKSPIENASDAPVSETPAQSEPETKPPALDEVAPAESATADAGSDAPPPPVPPPAPEQARRGYGYGALAGASIGSAALAALAVFGLQTVNPPSGPSPAALETRLAEVEKRTSAPAAAAQVAPAALAALEKRVASVEAIATGAAETARKAVEAAGRPTSSPQGASASPQALGALSDRLAALEKNADGAAARLTDRISALEKALAAPKTDDRATESRVEPAPAPTVDLDPLRKQIASLEARQQSLEKQASPLAEAARAAEARIKGVEERLQPLAGQVAEARAQGEAERKRTAALAQQSAEASRVALAQSLGAAISSGAPFAAQVEALAGLGVAPERLAPLREAAKTGVATNAQLASGLAALEPKIVTREEAPSSASVVDRLTSSALNLVRVRPAGDATGDTPAEIFARMTRATQTGDIAAALKDWAKLPDNAKAASADWAKRANDRLAAESAARALLSGQAQTPGRS